METFRLFGDLRLEDPADFLTIDRQLELANTMPLIEALEIRCQNQGQKSWRLEEAFERFQKEELAAWEEHHVRRSIHFLIRPAGQLNARVACHLYNPTFYTADPYNRTIEDISNCSIQQVVKAGFSSDDCFLFDHLARRDLSHYCDRFYPPKIREIHENFMLEMRDNMEAKVEVCWGARVENRMRQILKLRSFPLWGRRYKDVKLFLEMTNDEATVKRFILFVRHPASYLYFSSSPDNRERQAQICRQQDSLLSVAASLGQIQIPAHFYESSPLVFTKPPLSQVQLKIRRDMEARAREELASVAGSKAALFFLKEGHGRIPLDADIESDEANISPMIHSIGAEDRGEEDDEELRMARQEAIVTFKERLNSIMARFTECHPRLQIEHQSINILLDTLECSDLNGIDSWNELPGDLVKLFEDQDGLKIRQRAISSREGLERAYQLLHCQGSPEYLSLVGLSCTVLFAYLFKIARPRKKKIDHLVILRKPPFNNVSRKCHNCGQDVLDDVYPWYAKRDPELYVYWRAFKTCGNPGCKLEVVRLMPINPRLKTLHPCEKNLLEKRFARAKWEKFFIRSELNSADQPDEIELKCTGGCGCRTKINRPRWTVHEPAKLVETRLKCGTCKKMRTWLPLSEGYQTIADSSLQRLWAKFQKEGCQLGDYPRRPDIWFANHRISTRILFLKDAKKDEMVKADNAAQ